MHGWKNRVTGWISVCVALAVVVAGTAGSVSACPACVASGQSGCCSLRTRMLYGEVCPPGGAASGDDSHAMDRWGFVLSGPDDSPTLSGQWEVTLRWGGTADPHTGAAVPFVRCFQSPIQNGTYTCSDSLVRATVVVTVGIPVLIPAGGYKQRTGSIILEDAGGRILTKQTFSGSHLVLEEVGHDVFERTLYDAQDRPLVITQKRVVEDDPYVKKTYFRYTETGGTLTRKRITTEEYNSDNTTKRFATTVYAYYASGDYLGKLHFIVRPEGVKRYLVDHLAGGIDPSDPRASCGLDTAAAGDLDDFAEVEYTAYVDGGEFDGYVAGVTTYGAGCCGGGTGAYAFTYGTNPDYPVPPAQPTVDDRWNTWKTYRRIAGPGTLRTVEFLSSHDQVIFKVVQKADISEAPKGWVDHSIYYIGSGATYNEGQVAERRYPSACTGYTLDSADGWVTDVTPAESGSAGLVRFYGYHNPSGKFLWERVRQGIGAVSTATYVRRNTYVSKTYDGRTVYHVDKEYTYYGATTVLDSAYKMEIDHDYTYYDGGDSHTVEIETLICPGVPTYQNGSGTATQVVRHYKRLGDNTPDDPSDDLYYNDWTKHEDGRYSYTELGTGAFDFGQVVTQIEDVDEGGDGYSDFPDLAGWELPEDGVHLKTTYAYYDTPASEGSLARLKSVTKPGLQKTVYAYMYQKKTDDGKETTTALVTLVAPHMQEGGDDDGHYDYAPVRITVTDLAGRTTVTATGDSSDDADGNLANDWYHPEEEDVDDAFNGTLEAKAVNTYDVKGQLTAVDRYYDVGNAKKLTTTHAYDPDTGRLEKTRAPDGTVTLIVYDHVGRPQAVYRGGTGEALGDVTSGDLNKVRELAYDGATVGSTDLAVGDGNVTESRQVFGAVRTTTTRPCTSTTTAAAGPRASGTTTWGSRSSMTTWVDPTTSTRVGTQTARCPLPGSSTAVK